MVADTSNDKSNESRQKVEEKRAKKIDEKIFFSSAPIVVIVRITLRCCVRLTSLQQQINGWLYFATYNIKVQWTYYHVTYIFLKQHNAFEASNVAMLL